MSYEINYSNLTGRAKRQKALDDCKSYLGEERYNKIMAALETQLTQGGPQAKREFMLMSLAFLVGIQGYPAEAMIDEADGVYTDDLN